MEKNNRQFEAQIPKWIKKVIRDDYTRYLMRTDSELLKNLEQVYSISRVHPTAFVVFHLTVALMDQQKKNRFYEKAISDMSSEIIRLRTMIKKLEVKKE
jgi:hypothetical protein